jgi:hypothetical protein
MIEATYIYLTPQNKVETKGRKQTVHHYIHTYIYMYVFSCLCCFFQTGFHDVAQVGLKLTM